MEESVINKKRKLLLELHPVMNEIRVLAEHFKTFEKTCFELIGEMIKTMDEYGSDEKK